MEVATNGTCANRYTNTWIRSTPKTTETGGSLRGPLLGRPKTLSNLCRPTDALLEVWSFSCIFFHVGVDAPLRFPTFFEHIYALPTTALWLSRIRRKGPKNMQAAVFPAAVKCAVRCTRPAVLIVVHPAYVVRCSFVVATLLFPTPMVFSCEKKNARTSTFIHLKLTVRTLPGNKPGGEKFDVIYTIHCPIHLPFPKRACRQFFYYLALCLTLTLTTTTNNWGRWWYNLTVLPTPQPLHPLPGEYVPPTTGTHAELLLCV